MRVTASWHPRHVDAPNAPNMTANGMANGHGSRRRPLSPPGGRRAQRASVASRAGRASAGARREPPGGTELLDLLRMKDRPRPLADPGLRAHLRDLIEDALAGALPADGHAPWGASRGGGAAAARGAGTAASRGAGIPSSWSVPSPAPHTLVITKDMVTRALPGGVDRSTGATVPDLPDLPAEPSAALAVGAMVDVLFRQLVTTGAVADPWTEALEALDLDNHSAPLATWVRALPAAARSEIAAEVDRQVSGFEARWPTLAPGWLPRTHESFRVPLLGGRAELAARVDLAIGKPSPEQSSVGIVELTTGARHPHHRLDAHFYALVAALRDPSPPFMVATYYARTGEVDVHAVTPGILLGAARRVAAAVSSLGWRCGTAPVVSQASVPIRIPPVTGDKASGGGASGRTASGGSASAGPGLHGTGELPVGARPSTEVRHPRVGRVRTVGERAPRGEGITPTTTPAATQPVMPAITPLPTGGSRLTPAALMHRLESAVSMTGATRPGGTSVVVDAWFLDLAHTDPDRLLAPAEPFRWSPRAVRRSLGLTIVGAYVAGDVASPGAAAPVIADEAVLRWSSTGERTFGWEPWYSRLGAGGRAATIADAVTWATSVAAAVDWRRCERTDFESTRERARIGAAPGVLVSGRFDATVRTASGPAGITIFNGAPRGDIETKTLLPALARFLRPGAPSLPDRMVGLWPDARTTVSVRVDDHALERAAAAVGSALVAAFGVGAALTA